MAEIRAELQKPNLTDDRRATLSGLVGMPAPGRRRVRRPAVDLSAIASGTLVRQPVCEEMRALRVDDRGSSTQ